MNKIIPWGAVTHILPESHKYKLILSSLVEYVTATELEIWYDQITSPCCMEKPKDPE